MAHIELTPEQSAERARKMRERLSRPISSVMSDIERERAEADARYIKWIAEGGKS